MQIKVFFLLLIFGVASIQAEEPSTSQFELNLEKGRSSCGVLIVKKRLSLGMTWEDRTSIEEFKQTSQWVLSNGSLNPAQLRRFIEIAPITSTNTRKLLDAYDKRQEVVKYFQIGMAQFILHHEDLLMSLIALGKMRTISRGFENALIDTLASYLPLSTTVARLENPFPGRVLSEEAYQREASAWQRRFPSVVYSHWEYGSTFDKVRRAYHGEVGEPT